MGKEKLISGMIGLEIHCYLKTREKLFCECLASRERGLAPNTLVCPVCTGQPGAKPLLPNGDAVRKAVGIALVLGCTVSSRLPWMRKHYAWPDLPKGYQTTLSGVGSVPLGVAGTFHGIGITEMHLEEDPASWEPSTGKLDYNRSGLPLVEIVTAPDFSTAEEVHEWLGKLVHHLAYLKAVDTNAGIKVDVNVNLPGKTKRVEIKNVNSIEEIGNAIAYEFERQAREGGKVEETRRWDAQKGKTVVMRSKEDAADYRFLSDPDLPALVIAPTFVTDVQGSLPEAPEVKLEKLKDFYGLDTQFITILARDLDAVAFFEEVANKGDDKKSGWYSFVAYWIVNSVFRLLNTHKITFSQVSINSDHFIDLLCAVRNGKLTLLQGKDIVKSWYPQSSPPIIAQERAVISQPLDHFVREAIKQNAQAVSDYKNGEQKAFDFLLGYIMRISRKSADPVKARKRLQEELRTQQ